MTNTQIAIVFFAVLLCIAFAGTWSYVLSRRIDQLQERVNALEKK